MNSLSFKTKFGWITAFEEKNKIVRMKFGKYKNKSASSNLNKIKNEVKSFLTKKTHKINFNFYVEGNVVQKKIWKELTKIKFGKTKSYGEIAKKFSLSARHVGKICGQNKIVLAIPCHRVIRSDGCIGGFSSIGGIALKKKLLDFENSWKQ